MPQLKQMRDPEQKHVISKRIPRGNNNNNNNNNVQKQFSVEETTEHKSVGNRRQGRRRGKGKPLMLEDSTVKISSDDKRLMFHRRPGFGQLGTKCVVKANHFLADLADMELTQYSVLVIPEVNSTKLNKTIMTQQREFTVSIEFVAHASMSQLRELLSGKQVDTPSEALKLVDLVLKELTAQRYISVGRFFYSPNITNPKSIGCGLQSWRGFYQSIKPTQMGLSLNIASSLTLSSSWESEESELHAHGGDLKRICETDLGLISQCCLTKYVLKISKQYLSNVSLKINVKMGGRNTVLLDALRWKVPLVSDIPTIIFGADVTHPESGEDSNPSIAAVVASQDWPEVTKYAGLVSAQPHRQELIQDLYKTWQDPQRGKVNGGMIRELLLSFEKATGKKPLRIIFYRDGVSDGQFYQVLLYELDAIRKACASLEPNYQPPVTFIVVQKRHHTRLFPSNHNDRKSTDKSGNILPGTVVDTKICHPVEFDFYLCSHAGIQGTSRPAHYHVLWDENNFSADEIQSLTNNLCYTYARCTRSVSVGNNLNFTIKFCVGVLCSVPPAYYAHLAAYRARFYMEPEVQHDNGSAHSMCMVKGAGVRPLPALKEKVKNVMFYC
ncbi:hypothetical protein M8C21_013164 [Ambrosia artemisiifolia]|uniref:Piwi domain-containing protein n=1 Tax=Ambrosia artemisiifolia TaxID=4212 RepID=A0AAD5G3X6_AMBAR|nr:hypothetical protein M8C21_013164 [Ambrosia artemisiifolia]